MTSEFGVVTLVVARSRPFQIGKMWLPRPNSRSDPSRIEYRFIADSANRNA